VCNKNSKQFVPFKRDNARFFLGVQADFQKKASAQPDLAICCASMVPWRFSIAKV
jgi:hypothetical protein